MDLFNVAAIDREIEPFQRIRVRGQNRIRYLNSVATARKTSSQTGLSVSVWTSVTFQANDFDTDAIHDTRANTSRLVAPTTGKYLFVSTVLLNAANIVSPGLAGVRVIKNGGTSTLYGEQFAVSSTGSNVLCVSAVVSLLRLDYLEVQAIVTGSSGTYDLDLGVDTTVASLCYVGE